MYAVRCRLFRFLKYFEPMTVEHLTSFTETSYFSVVLVLRMKVNVYMYLVQISFSLFISLGTIFQTYYFNVSYTFVLLYDYDCLLNDKTGEIECHLDICLCILNDFGILLRKSQMQTL